MRQSCIGKGLLLGRGALALGVTLGWADEPPSVERNAHTIAQVQTHANYVWTLVAAFLVFFMPAGFAMVETGFTRAKNASNIMMKNLMDFALGTLAFWAVGFGLMFGASHGWIAAPADFSLATMPPRTLGYLRSGCFRWSSPVLRPRFALEPWPSVPSLAVIHLATLQNSGRRFDAEWGVGRIGGDYGAV